jgi:hypothetical protein
MSYALTRRGHSLVTVAVVNNNLTSLTVVIANAVNDIEKPLNINTLTHLRTYY